MNVLLNHNMIYFKTPSLLIEIINNIILNLKKKLDRVLSVITTIFNLVCQI